MDEHRLKAIQLRKLGNTYTEIAAVVPVSKATLSQWLRSIPTPVSYSEKLGELKRKAREKGWEARRAERVDRTKVIQSAAQKESASLMKDPLWLVGLTLYWAEGSKEKSWGRGTPITFTNMDPDTLLIFREWCRRFLNVEPHEFSYNLYIHDIHRANSASFAEWWAKLFNVPAKEIKLYYKKTNATHVRKNDGESYHGVFRLQVKRSVDMNRRVSGWTLGMINSFKLANQRC